MPSLTGPGIHRPLHLEVHPRPDPYQKVPWDCSDNIWPQKQLRGTDHRGQRQGMGPLWLGARVCGPICVATTPMTPRVGCEPNIVDPFLASCSAQHPWHLPGSLDGAGTIGRLVVSGSHNYAFMSPTRPGLCPPGARGNRSSAQLGEMLPQPMASHSRQQAAASQARPPAQQAAGA